MRRICLIVILVLLVLAVQAECTIEVTSSAFHQGSLIPAKYTCDGQNTSPPLAWASVPRGTKSFALIVDDPDAPMGTFVHWVLFDIPAGGRKLGENVPMVKVLPNGARQGVNGVKKIGYFGPCPPSGTHRYFFKVYALDTVLTLQPGATKQQVLAAMNGHIIGQGQLMGRYKKKAQTP